MDERTLYTTIQGVAAEVIDVLSPELSITKSAGGIMDPDGVFFFTTGGCILVVSRQPQILSLLTPWGRMLLGTYGAEQDISSGMVLTYLGNSRTLSVQQKTLPVFPNGVELNVVQYRGNNLPYPEVSHLNPSIPTHQDAIEGIGCVRTAISC